MERATDKQKDRQTDRQRDRQTNRRIGRQIGRQINWQTGASNHAGIKILLYSSIKRKALPALTVVGELHIHFFDRL